MNGLTRTGKRANAGRGERGRGVGGKEYFRLRRDYGRMYARDLFGEYLSAGDLVDVILDLQITYQQMIAEGKSQRELYLDDVERTVADAAGNMRVIYPFSAPYSIYNPQYHGSTPPSRPRGAARFTGVYVLLCHQLPDRVKIGQSIDLYQRSKGLLFDLGKTGIELPTLESLAFISTNNLNAVENMLHRKFRQYALAREWFQREPVEAWLEQFRSES